ncbi:hypothetical protein Anapl_03615 [Anas platyrhynchos]|uniref:Uncharacterized protein n=1 Tax=Anas platyrhynchos TaxID=8839 RepID=R0LNX6_ANAPL|nr:hypothetical protein Anapl_03615 [Anas platyrhynchos]
MLVGPPACLGNEMKALAYWESQGKEGPQEGARRGPYASGSHVGWISLGWVRLLPLGCIPVGKISALEGIAGLQFAALDSVSPSRRANGTFVMSKILLVIGFESDKMNNLEEEGAANNNSNSRQLLLFVVIVGAVQQSNQAIRSGQPANIPVHCSPFKPSLFPPLLLGTCSFFSQTLSSDTTHRSDAGRSARKEGPGCLEGEQSKRNNAPLSGLLPAALFYGVGVGDKCWKQTEQRPETLSQPEVSEGIAGSRSTADY